MKNTITIKQVLITFILTLILVWGYGALKAHNLYKGDLTLKDKIAITLEVATLNPISQNGFTFYMEQKAASKQREVFRVESELKREAEAVATYAENMLNHCVTQVSANTALVLTYDDKFTYTDTEAVIDVKVKGEVLKRVLTCSYDKDTNTINKISLDKI